MPGPTEKENPVSQLKIPRQLFDDFRRLKQRAIGVMARA
jgi:hypothetical protein